MKLDKLMASSVQLVYLHLYATCRIVGKQDATNMVFHFILGRLCKQTGRSYL